MLKMTLRRGLALALLGGLVGAGLASAEDRSPEKILAEIKAVEMPKVPADRQDRKVVQAYVAQAQKALETKSALIGELYKVAPENVELPKLMPERWQALMMKPGGLDEAKAEIDRLAAGSKNEKLVAEASFFQVVVAFNEAGQEPDPAKLGPKVDAFVKKFPKDVRGEKLKGAIAKMTLAASGERRQKEGVGKPFEIAFVDAIKGGEVSSKTLMGKVVVVDFWATWCGPCVGEMPHMKELYAKYKDKGVEFIGVSLDAPKDQGGYDQLKEFVEKNKIEWPQYYEDKGAQSDFATGWGIKAIPSVFLIDADGKLATVEARGQLDDLIPAYLEKAKKAAKP